MCWRKYRRHEVCIYTTVAARRISLFCAHLRAIPFHFFSAISTCSKQIDLKLCFGTLLFMSNFSAITRNKSGFGMSLIELLVVIGIVAVMSAIAVPSFSGISRQYRTMGVANSFIGDLGFARAEAIRQGSTVTICASSDGQSCNTGTAPNSWQNGWIIFSDPLQNKTANTLLRVRSALKAGDSFSNVELISKRQLSSFTFGSNGNPTQVSLVGASPRLLFTIRTTPVKSNATFCVEIKRTGRPEFQKSGTKNCI